MQQIQTVYRGRRIGGRCIVQVLQNGTSIGRLDPRLDLRNHSPTGFEWGYSGSGPAQLALALCVAVTGKEWLSLRYYQAFKRRIVAGLPRDGWELPSNTIALEMMRLVLAAAAELGEK